MLSSAHELIAVRDRCRTSSVPPTSRCYRIILITLRSNKAQKRRASVGFSRIRVSWTILKLFLNYSQTALQLTNVIVWLIGCRYLEAPRIGSAIRSICWNTEGGSKESLINLVLIPVWIVWMTKSSAIVSNQMAQVPVRLALIRESNAENLETKRSCQMSGFEIFRFKSEKNWIYLAKQVTLNYLCKV